MTSLFDDDHDVPATPRGLLNGHSAGGSLLPHTRAVAEVVVQPLPGTALDLIPAPYQPLSDGELSAQEEADLAACIAGVDHLRIAFWIAGKALDTMRQANLARRLHPNFAQWVEETWEISPTQMFRMVEEWPLGERIAKLGHKPRESHIRELVDFAKGHGDAAAAAVYQGVAETGRVTARILADVVDQLPEQLREDHPQDWSQDAVRDAARELASPRRVKSEDRGAVADITSLGATPTRDASAVVDTGVGSEAADGDGTAAASESRTASAVRQAARVKGEVDAIDAVTTVLTCLTVAVRNLTAEVIAEAQRDDAVETEDLLQEIDVKLRALTAVRAGATGTAGCSSPRG